MVGTHHALLRCLASEQDSSVLTAALRALGTVLVGSPYPRLPAELLKNCVAGVNAVVERSQQAEHDVVVSSAHWIPVLSAGVSCLAAALGVKPASEAVAEFLKNGGQGREMLQNSISCAAAHSSPGVQLEAIMVLRGLLQQYYPSASVQDFWTALLDLAVGQMAAALRERSPDAMREKVAQQSVLLIGDYLRNNNNSSNINEEQWQNAISHVLLPCLREGSSSLLRAASFIAISGINTNPRCSSGDSIETIKVLCTACCTALQGDEASPVRGAAARALTSLIAILLPTSADVAVVVHVLDECGPSVVAGCSDGVVAVRIQSALALAAVADVLWAWLLELLWNSTTTTTDDDLSIVFSDGGIVEERLLPAAMHAATDGDKVKPGGVNALGTLLGCRILAGNQASISEGVDVLSACLVSENAKVQWSACLAAGKVIEAAAAAAAAVGNNTHGGAKMEVERAVVALQCLVETSSNSRTRLLAETALASSSKISTE